MKWFTPALVLAWAVLCALAAPAQEVEPDRPELVLPEVVLTIEDLSVETIVTGLPEPDALVAPAREVPLPDLPDWQSADLALPDLETIVAPETVTASGERNLYADAVLGAGTLYQTYASVSLHRVGDTPRFGLDFLHDMKDGLAANAPGSGYNHRVDSLTGEVRMQPSLWDMGLAGSFSDVERGLQEQSPYVARTTREASASVTATHPVRDRMFAGGALDLDLSSELLASSDPRSRSETRIEPELFYGYETDRVRLELNVGYLSRLSDEDGQRVRTTLSAEAGLSERVSANASVGWHWSTGVGSLIPFQVGLSGTFSSLTVDISGGYRVQDISWSDVLALSPFAELPADPDPNHGWFADLGLALSLSENLSLAAHALFTTNSDLPEADPSAGLEAQTGLIPFGQRDALRLTVDGQLRWRPAGWISLALGAEGDLFELPALAPRYALTFDAEGANRSNRWGANLSLRQPLAVEDPPGTPRTPLLSLGAFTRLSDRVGLSLEAQDLLWPLLEEPRATYYPFEDPGIGAILKMQISF